MLALQIDSGLRRTWMWRTGAGSGQRAIAVVEQVDAKFFDDVAPAEALRVLRHLARLPDGDERLATGAARPLT
jgi:hypothetical protein